MSAARYLKCLCERCRGRIEFPVEGIGTTVSCPHCGQPTGLVLPVSGGTDRALHRTRLWAIGGVIVLVLLLVAAFVAIHLLQNIAPRVRRMNSASSTQQLPAKPAAAITASTPIEGSVANDSLPPADWLRTNELAISPIAIVPRPGSTLLQATGTVVNLSKRKRTGVVVELELLDADGSGLKQIRDYRPVLEPLASWAISVLVIDPKAKSARVLGAREKR